MVRRRKSAATSRGGTDQHLPDTSPTYESGVQMEHELGPSQFGLKARMNLGDTLVDPHTSNNQQDTSRARKRRRRKRGTSTASQRCGATTPSPKAPGSDGTSNTCAKSNSATGTLSSGSSTYSLEDETAIQSTSIQIVPISRALNSYCDNAEEAC